MTNDGSTEPFDGLRAPSTVEGLAEVQFPMTNEHYREL